MVGEGLGGFCCRVEGLMGDSGLSYGAVAFSWGSSVGFILSVQQ